jgi:hypothetical protein
MTVTMTQPDRHATEALTCSDCGRSLDTVWRLRVKQKNGGAPYVPLCASCAEQRAPECDWSPLQPCEHCGRGVRRPRRAPGDRICCSRKCSVRAREADRRAMREQSLRLCEWCRNEFQPTRRGQRTCPNRGICRRQKSRHRQQAKRSLPSDAAYMQAPRCECPSPRVDLADDPDLCTCCGKYLLGRLGLVAA